MAADLLSLKWNNHVSSFLHILKSLRNEDNYTDVTLTCNGKFYDVHKLVLSMCSDYFKEIFQRSSPRTQVFIVLKDVNCEDLELLLDYMYLGEISVKQDQLQSLIKAAECLKIKGLAVPEDESVINSSNLREPKKDADSPHLQDMERISNNAGKILEKILFPLRPHKILDDNSSLPVDSSTCDVIPKNEPITNEELENSMSNSREFPILHSLNLHQQLISNDNTVFGSTHQNLDDDKEICSPSSYNSQNATIKNWHRNSTEDSLIDDNYDLAQNCDFPFTQLPTGAASKKFLQTKHQCPYCGKYFPSNAHLTRHIRVHTGEKPFSCPICNYKANQKNSVVKHMKMRHLSMDANQ